MFIKLKLLIFPILIFVFGQWSVAYAATGTESLERFYEFVKTYSAEFEQIVLDETLNIVETSTGKMWLQRPGKFRWNYDGSYPKEILSDGQKFWNYDVDLKIVQVAELTDALGETPASFLVGDGNIKANYELAEIGPQGDATWVALIPKSKESPFEYVRLGFRDSEMSVLELVDGLGQTTRISMSNIKINRSIKSSLFDLDVPEDVDIVDGGL